MALVGYVLIKIFKKDECDILMSKTRLKCLIFSFSWFK